MAIVQTELKRDSMDRTCASFGEYDKLKLK